MLLDPGINYLTLWGQGLCFCFSFMMCLNPRDRSKWSHSASLWSLGIKPPLSSGVKQYSLMHQTLLSLRNCARSCVVWQCELWLLELWQPFYDREDTSWVWIQCALRTAEQKDHGRRSVLEDIILPWNHSTLKLLVVWGNIFHCV